MKISKIEISRYHQFEDFKLDLTYPKGHEKEGKALDKVCFIGQSGTGKTTLLQMIWTAALTSSLDNVSGFTFDFEPNQKVFIQFIGGDDSYYVYLKTGYAPLIERLLNNPIVESLLYFPSGLSNAYFDSIKSNNGSIVEESKVLYKSKQTNYLAFDNDRLQQLWSLFYEDVKEYQTLETDYYLKLVRQAQHEKKDIANEKLSEWKKMHPNPVEKIGQECLDIILNKFYLAVKTEIDKVKEINALQIRSLSDNSTIPYEKLSTGTKQIIFTAFPIYQLLEDNTIVLMDEPETSLYPDIQREIIPYYTSFDKEKTSQFFFATHSPIIASAFEPWEIVELKFDTKGKVYRDKYYEGDNHVDNYKIDPRYLRWDDILTKVFDLPVDSNAEFRSEKLMEYAILKNKIKALKEKNGLETPSKETKKIVAEFEKAYDLLTGNWAVTRNEKN